MVNFIFFVFWASGFSKIVELLLKHGATTALLDGGGQLIMCPQFEGVRVQIESHRQQHMKDVVAVITDRSRKAFDQLQKIWLVSFDKISLLIYYMLAAFILIIDIQIINMHFISVTLQ